MPHLEAEGHELALLGLAPHRLKLFARKAPLQGLFGFWGTAPERSRKHANNGPTAHFLFLDRNFVAP